jgi:hypothetical protein
MLLHVYFCFLTDKYRMNFDEMVADNLVHYRSSRKRSRLRSDCDLIRYGYVADIYEFFMGPLRHFYSFCLRIDL